MLQVIGQYNVSEELIYETDFIFEPGYSISYKIACAAIEDSDLCCPFEDAFDPLLPTECLAKTQIRLRGCAG